MKLEVLERKGSKMYPKLVDTEVEPDYKEKYLQMDGAPFSLDVGVGEAVMPGVEAEGSEESKAGEGMEKPKKTRKVKK